MTSERTTRNAKAGQRFGGLHALFGALFVVLLVLTGVAIVDSSQRAKHVQATRSDALLYASVVRAKLEGALNKRLRIAYGLAAFARSQHRELPKGFYDFAEALMHSGVSGIRSLQLAPGAVVRYVYPYTTNEKVIGHDLLADPSRRDAVVRAIEQRLFVVAGPLKLIQGGGGIIARLPIYHALEDQPGVERFWGFATIVMSADPLFAEAGLGSEQQQGFRVALRGVDGLGVDGALFYGDAELLEHDPVLQDVALPAGTWQVAVAPVDGWPTTAPASSIIWLIGIMLSLAAGILTCVVLLAPQALRREVTRATHALRDSEERFRSVAESANDAIVSADGTGHIIFWNRAAEAVFGYSADEAIGQSINMLIPGRFRDQHEAAMTRRGDGTNVAGRTIAAVGLRKDGREFPLELSNAVWSATGGTFFTAIIRDVSERKRFEREQGQLLDRFHQAQRLEAIGTLASGAAHEFNNILNAIMANADNAAMLMEPGAPAQAAIVEVQEGAWRAAEIVRQLLIFSDDREAQCLEPVDLPRLLDGVVSELRHGTPAEVDLRLSVEEGIDGEVLADPGQLAQALRNVCTNAIQAVDGRGRIDIAVGRVETPGETPDGDAGTLEIGHLEAWPAITVTVRDDGCGMSKATQARMFEPFFTTRAVGQGTGLGLAVVHGVVQRSGGAIQVTTAEGQGTAVTLSWPAASTAAVELRAADYSL